MARYSIERREWVVRQMMPPLNRTVVELVEETGISDVTLYAWRKQARAAGAVVPGDGKTPDGWSSEEKFRVVLESAALSESELGEYCRRKGLYAEQIAAAVVRLNKSKEQESVELFFDDINLLAKKRASTEITEQLEDDVTDMDEMLEDDFDDKLTKKNGLKKIDSGVVVVFNFQRGINFL